MSNKDDDIDIGRRAMLMTERMEREVQRVHVRLTSQGVDVNGYLQKADAIAGPGLPALNANWKLRMRPARLATPVLVAGAAPPSTISERLEHWLVPGQYDPELREVVIIESPHATGRLKLHESSHHRHRRSSSGGGAPSPRPLSPHLLEMSERVEVAMAAVRLNAAGMAVRPCLDHVSHLIPLFHHGVVPDTVRPEVLRGLVKQHTTAAQRAILSPATAGASQLAAASGAVSPGGGGAAGAARLSTPKGASQAGGPQQHTSSWPPSPPGAALPGAVGVPPAGEARAVRTPGHVEQYCRFPGPRRRRSPGPQVVVVPPAASNGFVSPTTARRQLARSARQKGGPYAASQHVCPPQRADIAKAEAAADTVREDARVEPVPSGRANFY